MRGRRDFIGMLLAVIASVIGLIVTPIIINLITGGRASAGVWIAFVAVAMSIIVIAIWQFLREPRHPMEADAIGKSFPPRFRNDAIKAIQAYQSTRLNQSLSRLGRVRMRLEADSTAVNPPQDLSIQPRLGAIRTLSRGIGIEKAYAESSEPLVILGMPGSGKTTTLLQLSRSLLDSARRDASLPLPVVIELATWGHLKRTRLRQKEDSKRWLFGQLQETYGIGKKVAQSWLADRKLALLFDGLDEVPQADRERCVGWINEMQETLGVPPMVVCCRTKVYKQLTKLHLQSAVAIQPLTRKVIAKWLDSSPLAALRIALAADDTLWELLDAPLWFDVMALVFEEGSDIKPLTAESVEERRTLLLEAYISIGLRRKTPDRYTDSETLRWLSQLARIIRGSNKAAIRRRKFGWNLTGLELPPVAEKVVETQLLPSMLACLAACFVFSIGLRFGLTLGIITGVVCMIGVIIATAEFTPPRHSQPSGSWQKFHIALPLGAVIGLLMGGIGVVFALLTATGIEMLFSEIQMIPHSHLKGVENSLVKFVLPAYGLWLIVAFGDIAWKKFHPPDIERTPRLWPMLVLLGIISAFWLVIVGIALITFKGRPAGVKPWCLGSMLGLLFSLATLTVLGVTPTRPNENAEWRPFLKAALFGLFPLTGVLAADAVGVRSSQSLVVSLIPLVSGIIGGVIAGFWLHLPVSESIVRPFFSLTGQLPWRLSPFLDYAADKNLLYREDGDYRFIHPLFVEHFAQKNHFGELNKIEGHEEKKHLNDA